MNRLVLAVTLLVFGALSFAETPSAASAKTQQEATARLNRRAAPEGVTHRRFSTAECSFTFTSGNSLTSLQYCVTTNGNIIDFETPASVPLIASKDLGEGYGICDASTHVAYSDYGGLGDSGNWNPARVVNHTATSVKIVRKTSDGVWTLTQTITQVAGSSPSARIAMALKNNSSVSREAFLLRYADADVGGEVTNNFDATLNSGLGWNSAAGGEPFGLELQNLGTVTFGYDAFVQNVPDAPDPCNPFSHATEGLAPAIDGSLVMFYDIPGIPKSATAAVTVAYKGW
jgi:hypothetical protein